MAIPVKLEVFEGPLDLLLHLIDVNKIDIYDIPISLITDQYLAYIKDFREQDMEVMSEFLVMAAQLLSIKSKMLLPPEEKDAADEADGDPRAELVERLLEYKMYKYAAGELKDRQADASRVLFKGMTLPEDLVYEEPPVDMDALIGDLDDQKLYQIYQMVMKRQSDKIDPIRSKYGRIVQEEVNLNDRISEIEALGRHRGHLSFKELLRRRPTKMYTVVTFLAVLEMMKAGRIRASQGDLFEDIEIEFTEGAAERQAYDEY